MRLVEEEVAKEVEQEQLPTPDASFCGDDSDKDEHETPVVTQQQLASIFDIGPAFALPPMEEMFYQVAALFSAKPLAQRA
jgi:NET1-associated nuclear protein 1 (U3 small nucleolar RNA-associated protein 17)